MGKHFWWNLFLIKLQNSGLEFYYKDTSAQVLSYEFLKTSKNTFL